jgi:hypothetical protein
MKTKVIEIDVIEGIDLGDLYSVDSYNKTITAVSDMTGNFHIAILGYGVVTAMSISSEEFKKIVDSGSAPTPNTQPGISENLLLKAIAVAQNPDLITNL